MAVDLATKKERKCERSVDSTPLLEIADGLELPEETSMVEQRRDA